jgi:putative ABC transport system permease protein
LRKVVGATRSQVVSQFLLESLMMNALSILIAIGIILLLRGYAEQFLGRPIHFLSIGWQFYGFLGATLLIGALLSGLYPAIMHSMIRPIQIFKGFGTSRGNGFSLRKVLVLLQFTASIILLIGTLTVYRQIQFMRSQALGVDLEHTLVTYSPMSMIKKPDLHQKLLSYKSEINRIAGVKQITTSSSIPGKEIGMHREDIFRVGNEDELKKSFSIYNVDADFYAAYNLNLLAGEPFRHEEEASTRDVIINEYAANQIGFQSYQDAINQYISSDGQEYRICGVVKNHHNESLKKAIEPILFFKSYQWPNDVGYYSIKIESADLHQSVSEIEKTWNRFYPSDHFSYFFADDAFDAQYKADQQFGMLFSIFSALAIIIAGSGLFGLIAYAAKQRTKEIGVRKILGALVTSLAAGLSWDYIKWTLLANLFAWPIAWYAMHKWLQNFPYHIHLTIWPFLLAGLSALVIALLTVSWQAVRAATANPVDSLRYE